MSAPIYNETITTTTIPISGPVKPPPTPTPSYPSSTSAPTKSTRSNCPNCCCCIGCNCSTSPNSCNCYVVLIVLLILTLGGLYLACSIVILKVVDPKLNEYMTTGGVVADAAQLTTVQTDINQIRDFGWYSAGLLLGLGFLTIIWGHWSGYLLLAILVAAGTIVNALLGSHKITEIMNTLNQGAALLEACNALSTVCQGVDLKTQLGLWVPRVRIALYVFLGLHILLFLLLLYYTVVLTRKPGFCCSTAPRPGGPINSSIIAPRSLGKGKKMAVGGSGKKRASWMSFGRRNTKYKKMRGEEEEYEGEEERIGLTGVERREEAW